jgi:hypothetical protein
MCEKMGILWSEKKSSTQQVGNRILWEKAQS